jgi:glycine/D-amino acid oxidase-like deaminating enzyme
MEAQVAVIGAGSSGLAVMNALSRHGVGVQGFERGSDVGGLWRYENDNGLSAAYASLRTNVSSPRMQYPSFAMPKSYGDFPDHRQMAAYLDAYADACELRDSIRFQTTVDRLEPASNHTWSITLDDGSRHSYGAIVVATGLFWSPRRPEYPGRFEGTVSHSHGYRTPEPYTARRVLVVGAGQSAAEIAVEVSTVAEQTFMSIRGGVHLVPRWIGRLPYDTADVAPLNRLPWRQLNAIYGARVARALGPLPAAWPLPAHRIVEGIPIVSSELVPAVRRGDIVVKPAILRLSGKSVSFVDGSEERIDRIIYASGYRINIPFLSTSLLAPEGRELPLYRRIAPPGLRGLYFAGFVDAPGGLLPVVEAQGRWIASAVTGRLRLPPPERMWQAIDQAERRTRERFPDESPRSVRCDPHAYRRLLLADLRHPRTRRPTEHSRRRAVQDQRPASPTNASASSS